MAVCLNGIRKSCRQKSIYLNKIHLQNLNENEDDNNRSCEKQKDSSQGIDDEGMLWLY